MNCKNLGHCYHDLEIAQTENKNEVVITLRCCECGVDKTIKKQLTPADAAYQHGSYLPKRVEIR